MAFRVLLGNVFYIINVHVTCHFNTAMAADATVKLLTLRWRNLLLKLLLFFYSELTKVL